MIGPWYRSPRRIPGGGGPRVIRHLRDRASDLARGRLELIAETAEPIASRVQPGKSLLDQA